MKKFLFSLLFAVLSLGGAFFAHQTFAAVEVDNTPDCDTVAIVHCGSMTENAVRTNFSKADVAKVYGAFGIRLSALSGSFENGVVWKDGRVTLGARTVATGAVTAGRWNNPTSDMKKLAGTDRAYVHSTSHFVTSGQTAWLKFDANGKFLFAIIKSCGNPVTAKAITPTAVCNSLTAVLVNRNTYRFTAKATVTNATIIGYTYNYGDGTIVTTTDANPSHTYAKPGTYTATLNVKVKFATTGWEKTIAAPLACQVKTPVAAAPTYSCDSLTKTLVSRNAYRFDAKSSVANGAKITAHTFDYGDGQKQTISTANTAQSATHTYAKSGDYTVRVTQTVSVDGTTKTVTNDNCVVKITVAPEPTYSCDELKFAKIDRTNYDFTAKASAANGATISKYHFDFGDSKSTDVTTNSNTAAAKHNYEKAGEYTIRTTVSVVVDGKTVPVTGNACVTKITVEEKPVPPTYSCDELTFTKTNRTTYAFTAKGSADNGAAITKYNFNFGDGKTTDVTTAAKTASTNHEFARAGEYTIRATVSVLANGQTIPVTGDKCVVKVTVDEQPPTPAYDCKSLGAELIGKKEDRTFKYNLTYTASGGATLRDVDFNFGDNSAVAKFTPAQLANVTHAYAADGEYKTVATVHFNVNDTVVDDACEVTVNPANPPEECKPGVPVGDVRCSECKPGIPTGDARCEDCKPGIPVGDARCTECKPGVPTGSEACEECKPGVPKGDATCEEIPHVLPSTGPEAIIGSLFGTSAIGYGAYSYLASRRAVRNAWKR